MSKYHCMLVSRCFEPNQLQRITSGLNTNFTLPPNYSFHKSSHHKSCLFSLFIFHGQTTWEPASSRETNFILQAYTGTGVSHGQHRKKSGRGFGINAGEWTGRVERSKEEIPVSEPGGCVVFRNNGKALWGCADQNAIPNSRGFVFIACLSGRSHLSPGERPVGSVPPTPSLSTP